MVVFGVLRAKKPCLSRENARFNFSKSFVGRIEPNQNYCLLEMRWGMRAAHRFGLVVWVW